MKRIITGDGSVTYYNKEAGDHYHTKSGAKEEAIEKHAKALSVVPGKVVFDICFGLGYSTAAALDIGPATVYCFENDREIIGQILDTDADFKSYSMIKEFAKRFLEGNDEYQDGETKLVMVFGDAREKIRHVDAKADYVFFAPFSPAKVPHMWTLEFFRDIRAKMNKGAKLSTFSCARKVRDNMREAGFSVQDGPVIGRRSPSTIGVVE